MTRIVYEDAKGTHTLVVEGPITISSLMDTLAAISTIRGLYTNLSPAPQHFEVETI